MVLKNVNFNIEIKTWDLLNKLVLKTGRSRSVIVGEALKMFFQSLMEADNG